MLTGGFCCFFFKNMRHHAIRCEIIMRDCALWRSIVMWHCAFRSVVTIRHYAFFSCTLLCVFTYSQYA